VNFWEQGCSRLLPELREPRGCLQDKSPIGSKHSSRKSTSREFRSGMAKEMQDVSALRLILREVHQGQVGLYRNALNQPCVCCSHPDFPKISVPISHPEFQRWMSHFVWNRAEILLQRREISRIAELLSGQSLANPTASLPQSTILETLERNPLLETIVEFMDERETYESTMLELLKKLREFAKERGLMARMSTKFPGGPNVLSRQLSRFSSTLSCLGIAVQIRRSNGSRVALRKLKDDDHDQSSDESSAAKSEVPDDLESLDDRASRIQVLETRKCSVKNSRNEQGESTSGLN
jgi:hypothetical protein